jgi:predicted nucleic acid-binding protein
MKRVALDTNRLTDFFRGDEELAAMLAQADEVLVPLIVLGELRGGFAAGDRPSKNEAGLQKFMEQRQVRILAPDETTASYYGNIFAQLKRLGRPIPQNDMWIAALVEQHKVTLITRDQHFGNLPQLHLA